MVLESKNHVLPQGRVCSARRSLYERKIRKKVEADSAGRMYVAIDRNGDFEVADDTLTASRNLLDRLPDAQDLVHAYWPDRRCAPLRSSLCHQGGG